MFCTKCGTPNLDTDRFCRNCSAPLVNTRSTTRSSQERPHASYDPQQSPAPPPYPGYSGHPVSQSGYGNPMMSQQKASGQAIAAMILSIFSLILCCFPAGIIGALIGKMELNAIREGRAPQAGEQFAKLGFYLGIASTVITGIVYLMGFLSRLAGF